MPGEQSSQYVPAQDGFFLPAWQMRHSLAAVAGWM